MATRAFSTRLLVLMVSAALTVLHQRVALSHWPLRSPIGELFMSVSSATIGIAAIALLVISTLLQRQRQSPGSGALPSITAAAILGAVVFGALYAGDIIPMSLAQLVSTSPMAATTCTVAVAMFVSLIIWWRTRRVAANTTYCASWGATEIILCGLFAVNMLLLALPEIRFVSGSISPQRATNVVFWPSFRLFYSDVLKMDFNPLFAGARGVLAYYTPEYFLTQMACVYLMAIGIAFFCAAVAPVTGYYAGVALVTALCWSKIVLLVVFTGTNVVTLFTAAGLAVWVLSEAYRVSGAAATRLAIIRTGLFIGVVGTLTLYTYAPSRAPCLLFLGAACLLLAWQAARSSAKRSVYVGALVASLLVPAILLIGEYRGDWTSFNKDFRASVMPDISNVHNGRPTFIDPEVEASSPDLPGYYGAMIAPIPQPDGSQVSGWVYWRRSPAEFAWVFWNNLNRIFAKQLPFPGGKVAWFFVIIGLAGSIATFSSRLKGTMYGVGVCICSLSLLSPFLIVLSPAEWRRGAAVILVFASLAGLGIHVAVRLCFPRVRESIATIASSILIVTVFARPAIDAIASTTADEVAIAMVCPFNPIAPLFIELHKQGRTTGKVFFVGSPHDRCAYSASSYLGTRLGGDRVQLLDLPQYTLQDLKTRLTPGDAVAVRCGRPTGGHIDNFCEELRRSPEATMVYAAPADGNELWILPAQ